MTSNVDTSGLSELGQAALRYIEMGFAVIPLIRHDKRPATMHGLNDWTDNPQDVADWWRDNPEDNIGIVCGQPSHGLLVIDIDIDESKDKDGYASLREWETMNGQLPETAVSITGSGGMHYLYRIDATRGQIRPSANIEMGIDIRCDSSYIVAPPSVHPNGNRYEWQDSPEDTPIANADGNVYALVDHIQRNGVVNDLEAKKANGKFKLPDVISEGKRDKMLYKYACHLRALGRTNEEISNSVYGANAKHCDPPLDKVTLNKLIRSACTHDPGKSAEYRAKESQAAGDAPNVITDGEKPWRTKNGGFRHDILAEHIKANDRACLLGGVPAVWIGTRWDIGLDAIEHACIRYDRAIKATQRMEVYRYLALSADTIDINADFDRGVYVQFQNATVDIHGQAVTPTPEMYIANTIHADYDVEAACPVVDGFLTSITAGDAETYRLALQVVAACLPSRRVTAQAAMLIGRTGQADGEASNGKSTYINAIKALIGGENYSVIDLGLLGKPFQRGFLVGKLANIGDDIPATFLDGEDLSEFKKLCTGESIFADIKGGKGYMFSPTCQLIYSCNEVPRLSDTTEGTYRRLAFLPFRRRFYPSDADYDPDMGYKLATTEARARLALLAMTELESLSVVQRGHFLAVADMAQEMAEVRKSNDVVLRWIEDETITIESILGRSSSSVYAEFERWSKANNDGTALSSQALTKRLIRAFSGQNLALRQRMLDGRNLRCYVVAKK